MHEITLGNKKLQLPENWGEIPSSSLAFCIKQLIIKKPLQAKIEIIRHLLKLKYRIFAMMNDEQVAELLSLLDWMDLKNMTEPIFPEKKINGIKYRMPKSEFENGTAFQYAIADEYYMKYIESHDEKELDNLISALLIDTKKEKQHSDRDMIEKRAFTFRKFKDFERVAILAYFSAVKLKIYNNYAPWLFMSDESGSGGGINFGWWGRYIDIAKTSIFGKLDEVYEARFYDIIVFLIQEKEAYLADKREIEKLKTEN